MCTFREVVAYGIQDMLAVVFSVPFTIENQLLNA